MSTKWVEKGNRTETVHADKGRKKTGYKIMITKEKMFYVQI